MARRHARGSGLAALVLVVVAAAAGCSDDSSSGTTTLVLSPAPPIPAGEAPLRVEDVGPAVAALEAQLGGPQRYFEINATPTLVNLFVATEGATQAVAYVYAVGELSEPAEPEPASGPTFAAADAAFDPTLVLSKAVPALPDSDFRLFAITGATGSAPAATAGTVASPPTSGGVQYLLTVGTADGGDFSVFLSDDGAILGTDVDIGVGTS